MEERMLKSVTDGLPIGQGGKNDVSASPPARPSAPAGSTPWIRGLVAAYFDFIWRSLRRLGVPEGEVDDAAQRVFWVALRRAQDIAPGSERAFLFGTAMHVARDFQRSRSRAKEVADDEAIAHAVEPAGDPEALVDRKRARQMLDAVLDAMNVDLRAVFVLAELEELTAPEIAALLDLSPGTVASRLRRARDEFRAIVKRVRAKAAGARTERSHEPAGGGQA